MADTKALRARIRSVDSTLHLTKAMGMVASSKIRRATAAMMKGREYAAELEKAVRLLTTCPECRKSPYMRTSDRPQKTRLVVIAGDRGLAGGYNANIFRLIREYPDAILVPLGKRACDRYGEENWISSEKFDVAEAVTLAKELCDDFRAGRCDRVGIVSTEYVSMMTQTSKVTWILPLTASDEPAQSIVFEPDEIRILNEMVPTYVAGMLTAAVRESFASEVAARRTAMDSAGKNAQEMIDGLQLKYNRARQGAITQEITEIVAGSGN